MLLPKGITALTYGVYYMSLIIINLQATVLDRVYLSHRGCLAVCLNSNCCINTTMSSDKTTRAKRRNMVAKFAGRQNKSYPMKSKVAYERDSKAVQREVEQTLADTLVPRNQAVQGD